MNPESRAFFGVVRRLAIAGSASVQQGCSKLGDNRGDEGGFWWRRGRDRRSLRGLARRRLEREAIDRVAEVAGREVAVELGRDARIGVAHDPLDGGQVGAKVEDSGPPVHWQLNDDEVERSLRFDTMRLRTDVISSPFDSDGEFLLHMDKQGRNTWDESLKEEGWTQHDWQDYSVHEFEVRRLAPDRWECRATEKYWNRDARQDREWAKYTSVPPMREQEPRDWKPLDEAWVPPIETAYQRYIHQAPEPRRGTQDSPEAA